MLSEDHAVGDVVLVTGGRDYRDKVFVYAALDELHAVHPIRVLVEGGYRGADRLARAWANSRGVSVYTIEADWDAYGSLAGPRRNLQMLIEARPDVVMAFPGDRGTRDMVKKAKIAGVPRIDLRMHLMTDNT